MDRHLHKGVDVSVIIVNHNNFKLLEKCLSTLFEFTKDVSFELIIVDNNSTAGDIGTVLSQFEKTILIRNELNRGFGAANNQALAISRGKYILFLNNDTVFFENSIRKVLNFAEEKDDHIAVGCKLLNPDGSIQFSVYDFPTLNNVVTSNSFLYLLFPKSRFFNKYYQMNRGLNQTTEVEVVIGAFLFAARSELINIGGFDERFTFYNEETDLCYRYRKRGGNIYYLPDTAIIHLKGGTANNNLFRRYRNESVATIKYYQKHFKGVKFSLAVFAHYLGMLIRIPIFFLFALVRLDKRILIRAMSNLENLFYYPSNQFKKRDESAGAWNT